MAEEETKAEAHPSNADWWTSLSSDHPLAQFAAQLPAILKETSYNEMYGIELQAPSEGKPPPHTTLLILQKFLRANAGALPAAKIQLTSALAWRKTYNPLASLNEVFPAAKFGGLGYIARLHSCTETRNDEDVVTFNIYGAAAKNSKAIFGDTAAFLRWRVALMELTLQSLNLPTATQRIPDYGAAGTDPYQAIQVHDYLSVSFFRQPGEVKAASRQIIDLFQRYYPETVSYKYFVNVPVVMQWMMGAMKMVMSADSVRKMTWMTYGSELHRYLGEEVAGEYGGRGRPLEEVGKTVRFDNVEGDGKEKGILG